MNTSVSEYIDVHQRIKELGCIQPSGLTLLPVNFESASSIAEFRQVSEAATVRTLLRTSSIPLVEIVNSENKPPYIQNNAFEWVAPTLFVAGSIWSQNPNYVNVALSVIANYVTDFFKGMGSENEVKMEIIVERTKSKTCKKISYKGPPEGLKELPTIIKATSDE